MAEKTTLFLFYDDRNVYTCKCRTPLRDGKNGKVVDYYACTAIHDVQEKITQTCGTSSGVRLSVIPRFGCVHVQEIRPCNTDEACPDIPKLTKAFLRPICMECIHKCRH